MDDELLSYLFNNAFNTSLLDVISVQEIFTLKKKRGPIYVHISLGYSPPVMASHI